MHDRSLIPAGFAHEVEALRADLLASQQLRAEDREQLQGMEDQLFAALEEVRQLFQLLDA